MNTQVNAMGGAANHGLHRQHASHLQALHEQQQQQQPIPHHQPQPQHHFSNPTSLLENHHPFENRPFVPDGMVPGLRPPPLPRTTREGGGMQGALSAPMYSDGMDDSPFTVQQRVPPLGSGVHQQQQQQQQQQQVYEPLVGRGSLPQLYGNAGVGGTRGGGGGGMFQVPFRAEPSPLGGQGQQQQQQQQVQPPPPQRLPPGLANLGGRPPHDPNGYLGGMGMHGPGVGHQQTFNGFGGGGGIGFGGMGVGHGPPPQQPRGPPAPPPPPPMQTLLNNAHNALSGSGHGGEFTVQHHPGVRGPPPSGQGQQQQGMLGGMRFGGQGGHLGSGHGLRQQQGPHIVPQMLPMHLQQQQQQQQQQQAAVAALHGMHGGGGGQSQNEHLLSMLMGGIPRD